MIVKIKDGPLALENDRMEVIRTDGSALTPEQERDGGTVSRPN
ncbi:MAG TPA: hypothetical protein VNO43_16215 [Candidatus Eisenbacteria bacterium]|nr:hypothetical protein [Candidatus Eisenbacteria bacterium]